MTYNVSSGTLNRAIVYQASNHVLRKCSANVMAGGSIFGVCIMEVGRVYGVETVTFLWFARSSERYCSYWFH